MGMHRVPSCGVCSRRSVDGERRRERMACAALYSKRQQGLVLALVAESDSSLSCASLDSLTEETLLGADS